MIRSRRRPACDFARCRIAALRTEKLYKLDIISAGFTESGQQVATLVTVQCSQILSPRGCASVSHLFILLMSTGDGTVAIRINWRSTCSSHTARVSSRFRETSSTNSGQHASATAIRAQCQDYYVRLFRSLPHVRRMTPRTCR